MDFVVEGATATVANFHCGKKGVRLIVHAAPESHVFRLTTFMCLAELGATKIALKGILGGSFAISGLNLCSVTAS
jgi:hypothetical protein